MIFRFSLYGFLKNQRYFEAFLFLAFLEKGLDFFQIGLLVGFRSLAVNIIEVPSGAIADVFGRRGALLLSLAAYLVGFIVLGAVDDLVWLGVGMTLLALGDSFRSGTHKAMIFTWLSSQGRTDERVKVYGYTRSWSKFGSALAVVAGAAIVLVSDTYSWVFYATAIPYVLGIINILGYPKAIDTTDTTNRTMDGLVGHLLDTLRDTFRRSSLRRLVLEAMGFDGVFAAVKDYLQPVLAAAAIPLAATITISSSLSETQQTALLVGPVYVVLYLLAGLASRRSHQVSTAAGGEDRAARRLWGVSVVVFAVMLASGWFEVLPALIGAFVVLHVLHNVWRPILISRFDLHGDEKQGASLLSIESQAQRMATMILAPLLGLAVDRVAAGDAGGSGGAFWPLGAVGLVVSLLFLAATLLPGGGSRRRAVMI
ncbi:MAG: MFS transporter [Vicinamibacterales bacterium]